MTLHSTILSVITNNDDDDDDQENDDADDNNDDTNDDDDDDILPDGEFPPVLGQNHLSPWPDPCTEEEVALQEEELVS